MPLVTVPTTNAQPGGYNVSDFGVIAQSYDPGLATTSTLLTTAGTVYVTRLKNVPAASITNVCLIIANAGVTLTAGQCFAALYQGTTLIGTTADQAANWQSTGSKIMPLTGGPFAIGAGEVFVAFFYNGTTAPGLIRSTSFAAQTNFNLSNANSRFASADVGRTTTMPSPLGALTAIAQNYWVGIS